MPAVETAPTIAKRRPELVEGSPYGDSEFNRRRSVSQGWLRIHSPGGAWKPGSGRIAGGWT